MPNEPITILSWNIQVGHDSGLFANGWPERKSLVTAQIAKQSADIICLQEPLWAQLTYILLTLKGFDFAGCGRDDGAKRGEFCPIIFNTKRFKPVDSGTFWLNDNPDKSRDTWDFPFKRICSWAKLNDLINESHFYVFNSHFPLNVAAHQKSAQLLAQKKLSLCGATPCFITADFNCDPCSFPEELFKPVGMQNCARSMGREKDLTMTVMGKPNVCIDAIFASHEFMVQDFGIFGHQSVPLASDHLGLVARVSL